MSKITAPILLDSTGQAINDTLIEIKEALLARNTVIDDTSTSETRVWSSKKIVDTFTKKEQTSVGSSVVCLPVAATPLIVEGDVEIGELQLTISNEETSQTFNTYIPAAGHYNWATGLLTLPNGQTAIIAAHPIMALENTNTISINQGTIQVTYRALAGGTSSDWSIIHGGDATEEV